MIFSRFFKSGWQSKDVNHRIAAVNDELDRTNSDDYQILIELLTNDSSELVRRAVLLKLNDFAFWLKASESNSNNKVREYALQQVEAIILDQHQIKLSTSEKAQFLTSNPKTALLEMWLNSEKDSELALSIFEKLAKPQLLPSVFAQRQQAEFQLKLLDKVNSKELLEKLAKKSHIAQVREVIHGKLAQLTELEQKPGKITKQAQLILAKLLALKDVSQYQEMLGRKEKTIDDWQQIQDEFHYLTEAQQQEFTEKYQSITLQLEKIFAPKAEAYEQQLIVEQLALQRTEQINAIDQQVKNCEQKLSNSIFEHNSIDETAFTQAIDTIKQQIADSVLTEKQKVKKLTKCQQLQHSLQQLPVIAESVTEATHLISKISQLSLPQELTELNDKEALYQQWLKDFKQVIKKAAGALPESINQAYQEIVELWQQALKPLQQAQQKNFNQAQRKLNDVKRLIHSGKFNAAFGVFNKAQNLYNSLNDKQQARLIKDYQFAETKINELSDWEHYIATPRKQELLAQVKQLASKPLDNPVEQASQVKYYRKQWNLLGHADDDKEQALNDEFNQLSEQAFAPCRLYYAEQEKLRAQHLTVRKSIIAQVSEFSQQLSSEDIDAKKLDGKLNQFKQKWRNAGEVERSKYQTLNQEFNTLLKPVKTALYQLQQENIKDKQALIDKATHQLSNGDVEDATRQLKQLQAQWQTIGYCGPKQENKLWQEFRAINDQVFHNRASVYEEQKKQFAAQEQQYLSQLAQILIDHDNSNSIAQLTQTLTSLNELQQRVGESTGSFKSVKVQLAEHIKSLSTELNMQRKLLKHQELVELFAYLAKKANGEQGDEFSALSKTWQKRVNNIPADNVDHQLRHRQTIVLEILAGFESPKADQQQRLALQVELMQDQMTSGQNINLEQKFVDWLMLGPLTKQDFPLLTRIKPILLTS